MAKVWVLDTETKGTGAHVPPLEKTLSEPAAKADRGPRPGKQRARASTSPGGATGSRPRQPGKSARLKSSSPLPPGHVRKKATGEIGRVQAVDPKAGTATVLWLRQARTSTVPLAAISRR